jgi:hypothetical protein
MRPLPLAGTAAVAAVAICAAPASAATVSPSGVRFPQVAIAPGGRTIVAWERSTRGAFGVEARVGPGPRHLGARVYLASRAYSPKVAVGADGTAAVMWMQSGPGYRTSSLRVAIARPGHALSAGQLVDRRRGSLRPVGLAVQPTGRAVAVWTRGRRTAYALARRGRRFGAAADVAPGPWFAGGSVVTDPRDGAVVLPALAAASAFQTQVGAAVLTTSATTFAEQAVAGPSTVSLGPGPTAVTGPGGAGIAYAAVGDPERRVILVRRRADGSWAPAELVAAPLYPADDFVVDVSAALAADGSAVAAWSVQTDDPAGFSIVATRTVAAIAGPGAAFGMPLALTPAGQRYSAPSVAAATGAAFVATARPHGPVLVSTRALGTPGFLPATTLASHADGDVELAAGGRRAVAAYQVDDHVRLTVLR